MRLSKELSYWEDDTVQYLQLPYKGNTTAINIFLPKNGKLKKFINKFDLDFHNKAISMKRKTKIELDLPKFKIEESLSMKSLFKKLGMTLPFNESQANFSKMTKKNNLFIGQIYHKTFLKIDEKGSEAAGATAVVMQIKSLAQISYPIQFIANKPFFITITDTLNRTILFHGYIQGLK